MISTQFKKIAVLGVFTLILLTPSRVVAQTGASGGGPSGITAGGAAVGGGSSSAGGYFGSTDSGHAAGGGGPSSTSTTSNFGTSPTTKSTTTTPPATSSTETHQAAGAAGKTNDQVDSAVTIKPGGSFDQVLGLFWNPLEFESVPELIIRLINIGLLLAGMAAVVVIIVGGLNLVTAMGNETKITQGKKSIMWAIAGLIVCLLSFSIVAIIQKVISS